MIRECLNDWVFIAKVPISRLDDYLFGRDAAAPDDLRAGYSTNSLEPTTTAVVSTEPGIRGNPRKTRRMSWKLINPEKCNLDKVVLKETLLVGDNCQGSLCCQYLEKRLPWTELPLQSKSCLDGSRNQ